MFRSARTGRVFAKRYYTSSTLSSAKAGLASIGCKPVGKAASSIGFKYGRTVKALNKSNSVNYRYSKAYTGKRR